ncbi:hypothetical protein ACSBR8_28145 [Pseudomonas aeruginosa]|uniref:hypothetical protein n=1 Tax=Pseudomonas aeruginosa TaxID=287 RepID=UPI001CD580E9|nr:hypothetical protein [Pseudomonas aeruginosa]MBX6224889.1 hypothetical protein [Pseudomonas aeruginosa]MCZ9737658.1 hypothetical protein [Pseudomonas aeruginosa]HCF6137629.1 hypothetical protein [Pseudomonas aeruginosa]HEJ1608856.1 hypothetical protein [Pseudomonas aeruginosa]HEJ5504693.1 hypothetical protein [Pseudomonas aeruginosa]
MKILKFEILSDGDIVDRIENNVVHVRKANGAYVVYTLKTEDPSFMDFDVFVVQKGDGFISMNSSADLSDLDKINEVGNG